MEIFNPKRLASIYSNELLILFISLVSYYFLKLAYKRWKKPLPPGPWGLPLVGYKYYFGNMPHKHFKELGKKYGTVIGVSVGSQYFVIFNDYDTMTEAYKKDESLGRVSESFYNFSDSEHFGTMNGLEWKEQRKCFSGFFRNLFRTDNAGFPNLHTILEDEIDHILKTLKKANPKESINIRELLREGTNNTLFKYIFGKTYPADHPIIDTLAEQQEKLLEHGIITDWTMCFPKLRFITRRFLPEQQDLKRVSKMVEKFVQDEIENHKKTFDSENPRDYIDYALLKERSSGKGSTFNDSNLNSNIQILLTGGTDTTRTSMEWMFMLMAKFSEIQLRIYSEIEEVFGVNQKPKWEDRYFLPYTMAAIHECQRWKTIVPISTPRMAMDDLTISGYCIPKGSAIAGNIWAIHNDETYWDNPSEFNPERYLTKDGKFNVNERLMAFSHGKRDCPGKNQAIMELFLFLAAVLQKNKILPPVDGISLEENHVLVTGPVKPYVRFEPRLIN